MHEIKEHYSDKLYKFIFLILIFNNMILTLKFVKGNIMVYFLYSSFKKVPKYTCI